MSHNEGVTKLAVIHYILTNDGPAHEPTMRTAIKKRLNLKDDKNIKRCIKELHNSYCVHKLRTRKGSANKWDILSVEHLRNINRQFEVDVQQCKKVMDIINATVNYDILSKYDDVYRSIPINHAEKIVASESMFNAVIEEGLGILYPRWTDLYITDNDSEDICKHGPIMSPTEIIMHAFKHYVRQDVMMGRNDRM